jgi:outer membrane receptor protein involved in Fe transport
MRASLLILALLAAPATAQEIVVTGQALPDTPATPAYDVQVIDRRALTHTASDRIEDALGNVAGFQEFRRSDSRAANPSAQGATLRALGGNAATRTLVLLDGVPMLDPFFGYVPFSAISPERLARAQVTRGGGSGAFGAGAVAGVIDLASAGPEATGLLNASLAADQRGETALSADLAPRLGDGFAEVGGRWDRGEGFWTTPVSQRVPASVRASYASWSANARAVAPLTDAIELQARGLAYRDARTLRFAGATSTSIGEDASLRLIGRGAWAFDALAYLQARDFTNIVVSSTSFKPTLNQYATPSTGFGGKLELRPPVGGSHVLRLGVDGRSGRGHAREVALSAAGAVTARRDASGTNSLLGAFAEDDWTLGRLVLTAGIRADRWSIADGRYLQTTPEGIVTGDAHYPTRTGWQASWRAGAALALTDRLKLRAAGYSNFREPTLNELYRPFTVFPVTTLANPALGNERLIGAEVGLDAEVLPGAKLGVTLFNDRLDDAIANVTIGTNLKQRMNVDAIRARGIEGELHVTQGTLSFDGSLAWTDAVVEASGIAASANGLRPAQTPRLAASATLGWTPGSDKWANWHAALILRHVGAQFEDDQNVDTLPAATTLGAIIELPLTRVLHLALRGENLTDTLVETRNQAGSIDLGTPRTVWLELRARMR